MLNKEKKKQFLFIVLVLIGSLVLINRDFRTIANGNRENLSNGLPKTNNAVPIWNVSYGYISYARDLALDSQGNVYAFGDNYDLILIKYDSNGNQIWDRRWGYSGLEQLGGVAVGTDDSIYIASFSESPLQKAVLIKYDPEGNQLWNATYQTSSVYAYVYDVVVDSENNAYIVGITDNAWEIFLLKFNSSGVLLNQTVINAPTSLGNHQWSLYMDESDFLYVTGGPWKTYNGFLLAKYTSQCVQIWNRSLSLLLDMMYDDHTPVTDVCVDSSNNIYITGFYEDTGQTVLMKYDSVGLSIWNATHDEMMAYSVRLDSEENPHIAGYSKYKYHSQGWCGIIAKFSSDGIFQWNHTFWGNGQHTLFHSIEFDEKDHLYSIGILGSPSYWYIIVVKFGIDETSPDTTLIKIPSSTIHYSDFNFTWTGSDDITPTDQLVYSYYLEGNESGWSPWTSQTWTLYEFLANGTYTFHVRSKDTGGNIDPNPESVTFTVATPNWRRYAHMGSILLHRTCGILMPILNWTHAGLYIGEGDVVEARAYWDGGVSIYDITDWDKTNRNALVLNVTTATQETKINAAAWALFQAERTDYPLGEYAISGKRAAVDSKFWYCSELVWASYFNYGINLDNNVDLFDLVTPDDLHNNPQTTIIGSHWEDLWCGDSMLVYVRVLCPVNLRITDPDGLIISNSTTDIDGACYIEMDINDDGEQNDILGFPLLNYGKYFAEILLEPDALPTDTFSLIVTFGDKELIIVEDMLISDLPEEPFVFYVYENGIFLTSPDGAPREIGGYDLLVTIISVLALVGCIFYIRKRQIP